MYDNLKLFFENIKSLGFWRRIFGWRKVRTLSYDAYDEYTSMAENLYLLNREISERDARILELERSNQKNAEISSNRISDLTSSTQKLDNRIIALENELSRMNREKTELSSKIARFEQADQNRKIGRAHV